MDIIDFSQGQIWGIIPEKLDILIKNFDAYTGSKEFTIEAAKFTMPNQDQNDKPYDIVDGVAVITISGAITKRDSFFSYLYGGSSTASITKALNAAINDPQVQAIVLSIDCPGGPVNTVETLTEAVRSASEQKPVVAYANGMMASAAYWIGSAAQSIVAEKTAEVGSIGVVMVHYDYSESDRQYGVKRTFITAGKYKAMGNSAEPLSAEARTMFEGQLNHFYNLFVDTVAENRKIDSQAVIDKMADGKIFIGQQAIDAGLVDSLGNLSTAINTALQMVSGSKPQRSINFKKEAAKMEFNTVEQLAAAYPALVADIRKQAAAGVDVAGAVKEATAQEKERILGIALASMDEESGKKLRAVVESNITVDQYKAIVALNPPSENKKSAEEQARETMLSALQKSGAANPGAGGNEHAYNGKDFMTLVDEQQAVSKCSRSEAMQKVIAANPKAHEAYLAKVNSGVRKLN